MNYCSCSLSSIPIFPTKLLPFSEGNEVPARDRSKHSQCQPVGPCLLKRKTIGCPNSGGSFDAYSSTPVTPQTKMWLTNKPQPSGCPMHSERRTAGGVPHPVCRYLGGVTTIPQWISTESPTTMK